MRAVIVTGSRYWTDDALIDKVLREVGPDVLIHGDALGADTMAAMWGYHSRIIVLAMPAQWERDGKRAGPERNGSMLHVLLELEHCGYKGSVEAFPEPNSRGTWDMVRQATGCVEVNVHGPYAKDPRYRRYFCTECKRATKSKPCGSCEESACQDCGICKCEEKK